ncbi:hypothetical protein BG011_004750 [Mortierella polycephala]|uniref:Uncharacterized protein n=1 Tax=Mortierella polycephala TaxID=41804 RepID=A0A9P6PXF8_9FUNG|nr:hypothetical protein BG011_004750 [Mortierella polycephala]
MRIQWTDLKAFDMIGSGSFGRVFHGELLGTEVAIKECVRSNSRAFDEKYFKREVDILKQSRHPNIVQFMGICKRKKRFYIVTEFLPLGNLRRWIQDETKEFGWDTRISFAIDISLALAYLHHKNIIHRDLKGENLLISENMRIKVCDFGFSRVEARDDDEMRRISYCGTDGYMAPEILLGEDFDCSVDVFSLGIVLAEMMARHVVDSEHFQRQSPDMSVSTDEILFRAQPGCPIELGELAIHCVQPLPENRPKLQQIVQRLTTIENVDIHVGTTLVVAPSVARAARNMMRKKDVAAKRHEQQYQNQGMDKDLQPHQVYLEQTSSIRGEANTWRMTDLENASSRITESVIMGSNSTFRSPKAKEHENEHVPCSSTIPLFLEERYHAREHINDTSCESRLKRSSSEDDEPTFRMPLWDSVSSGYNQQDSSRWRDRASVNVSTIKGVHDINLPWSMESSVGQGGQRQEQGEDEFSRLSSIQIDLLDDDKDEGYTFGCSESSDEDDDDDGEDKDSLFSEDSDQEIERLLQGHQQTMYELSSDSDASFSCSSLTESVVMALDTLDIPDLTMAKLPNLQQQQQSFESASPLQLLPNIVPALNFRKKALQAAPEQPIVTPQEDKGKGQLFRQPSLISRLLPPIPTTEIPWTPASEVSLDEIAYDDLEQQRGCAKNEEHNTHGHYDTGTVKGATVMSTSLSQNSIHATGVITTVVAAELENGHSVPPVPPSKSKRSGSEKSSPGTLAQKPGSNESPLSTEHSATTSTAPSSASSPSISVSSSSSGPENEASAPPETQEKVVDTHRGFGLVRGMSDSFWGLSTLSTPNTIQANDSGTNGLETGTTITNTLVAAMGAKTWTGGTGGFGQWIGQYTHQESTLDPSSSPKMGLRKHTSLKEGKQRMGPRGIVTKLEEGNEEVDLHGVEAQTVKIEEKVTVVKRRPKTMLTGISHRFSLVAYSALLLPKCDACQKRLGVLPGWSSKHLECDDCGYKIHAKCVSNVVKSCTSARKSGVWEIPV